MVIRIKTAPVLRSFHAAAIGCAFMGCLDVEEPDAEGNEEEVITRVALSFSPVAGGDDILADHSDPENDGSPVIDPITLATGAAYTLRIGFANELADPVENMTAEVEAEDDEHQVFVYGGAVEGPATGENAAHILTHTYVDRDDNGHPVGLVNRVIATSAGTGDFKVMLRHLPAENGAATKVAGLAEAFATSGGAIAGDADVDVTFTITVE